MILKFGIVLYCCIIVVYGHGNCEIDAPGDIWSRLEIVKNDVPNNAVGIIAEYDARKIKSVSIENVKYVNVKYENEKLTFTVTDEYKHYVEKETSTRNSNNLKLICEDGTQEDKMKFIMNIIDTENHPPEFKEKSYIFNLPMPLPNNYDIPNTNIVATDIDLGTKKLKFDITGQYSDLFEFASSKKNNKQFTTYLKTRKPVNIEQNVTIDIQVTDDHQNDPKRDSAKMSIQIDKKNSYIPIPMFQEPIYQKKFVAGIQVDTVLKNKNYKAENSKLEGVHNEYFELIPSADSTSVTIKNFKSIPDTIIEKEHYILLTLETSYAGAESSGKTVILLDLPEHEEQTTTTSTTPTTTTTSTSTVTTPVTCPDPPPCTTETPTPCDCSTCPTSEPCVCTTSTISTTTVNDNSTSTTTCPVVTPEPCDCSTTTVVTTACPTVTPEPCDCSTTTGVTTACPTVTPEPCDCSTVTVTTCPSIEPCSTTSVEPTQPCEPCPTTCSPPTTTTEDPGVYVKFEKKQQKFDKKPDFIGDLGEMKAKSNTKEDIEYTIKSSTSNILPNLKYDSVGMLSVSSKIPPGIYSIILQAKGVLSGSEDTAEVSLSINGVSDCDGKPIFPNSLLVKELEEEKEHIVFPGLIDHQFIITGDNPNNWFKIQQGNLWVNKIDREDPSLLQMYQPQVKTTVQIVKNNAKTSALSYGPKLLGTSKMDGSEDPLGHCIYTSSIDNDLSRMTIAVIVKDINDNIPIFDEASPFVVGYPNSELNEYISPPYVVKLTATDKDAGVNALIKYTTDSSKFIIDPYNGIVLPKEDTFENEKDVEFNVQATDQDGKGQSSELTVKVKILKKENLSTLIVKNVLLTDLDKFIANISSQTGKKVRYLSSSGSFETRKNSEQNQYSLYENGDNIPVLKIVTYALDEKDEPIESDEFKKLVEDKQIEVVTKQYEPPRNDEDNSGWVAAVSTLSVLLALIIIGVLIGYIFLIRPKILLNHEEESEGYIKHKTRETTLSAPIEEKMESSLANRRPTGFPLGFKTLILDNEDEDEKIEEEEDEDKDEGINNSESSSNTDQPHERKKSVVKFDNNVTEIEIEEF